MGGSRQIRTPKLGIVLQITDVTQQGTAARRWVVHDVERNRGFQVTLASAALDEVPSGETARTWSEDDVQGAIGVAIERFLASSPQLVAGPLYDVQVMSRDLFDFAKLGA
jgi:hypothetical protein